MVSKILLAVAAAAVFVAAVFLLAVRKASVEADAAFDAASSRTREAAWEKVASIVPPPSGINFLLCTLPVRAAVSWDGRVVVATPAGLMIHAGAGRFESLGPGKGLCPCDLTALASRDGELWAGTRDSGFFRIRHDWAEAITLPGGPRCNAVIAMASGRGMVLAATAGGVWSLKNDGAGKISDRGDITAMAVNQVTGAVIAGAGDGSLLFLEPGSEPKLRAIGNAERGHTGLPVRAVAAEGSGFLVGTSGTANRIDPLGGISMVARNVNVAAFAVKEEGSWVLTEDGWAFRIPHAGSNEKGPGGQVEDGVAKGSAWVRILSRPVGAGSAGNGWFLAVEGGVWTGSDFEGLLKGGGNPWRPEPGPRETFSLSTPVVSAVLETGGGLLAGHFDGGVDLLDPSGTVVWSSMKDSRIREVNAIRAMGEDSAGICSSAGLALLSIGEYAAPGGGGKPAAAGKPIGIETWIPGAPRLAGAAVYDVRALGDGSMIIASSGGISILDPATRTARHLTVMNGLPSNRVYTLAPVAGGVLAGTLSGIALIENCVVSAVWDTATSGLPAPWVTAVFVAAGKESTTGGAYEGSMVSGVAGEVLVGTYGGGAAVWNPGNFQGSAFRAEIPVSSTKKVGIDPAGRWAVHGRGSAIGFNAALSKAGVRLFGTLDRGIMVIDRDGHAGQQRYFRRWLPSPAVNCLSADGRNVVVAGTGSGIALIPLSDILENAE